MARDDQPATAHQIAASTSRQLLPGMVGRLVARHHQAAAKWRAAHDEWRSAVAEFTAGMARSRERSFARSRARDRSRDEGLEL